MAEMVERVARAILAAHDWTQNEVTDAEGRQSTPEVTGWDAVPADWQEVFRAQAHAAIEAMREPTGIMIQDGMNPPMLPADFVARSWRAMIEAALTE